ncbi:hypothetical protein H6501_02790 [Candidatus Woesearchaeota archaeon]|nr:hypothetical protein [Nanoarchaeota archaeon]MCB9370498.1 hypothetical protein [Candidatus Woesearchaeota archaeon]USN43576.1 MAG: hypothetical protein H6500_04235 [Candidatus Woesearchaeota archaeon]
MTELRIKNEAEINGGFRHPAYICFSFGKPLFHTRNVIDLYFSFMKEKYSKLYVILPDTPREKNILVVDGLCESELETKISNERKNYLNLYQRAARRVGVSIELLCFSELLGEEHYLHNKRVLEGLFEKDETFRQDVLGYTRQYLFLPSVQKKLSRRNLVGLDIEASLVANPLMELAMVSGIGTLFGCDILSEVYPENLVIQKKLQSGFYDGDDDLKRTKEHYFVEAFPKED